MHRGMLTKGCWRMQKIMTTIFNQSWPKWNFKWQASSQIAKFLFKIWSFLNLTKLGKQKQKFSLAPFFDGLTQFCLVLLNMSNENVSVKIFFMHAEGNANKIKQDVDISIYKFVFIIWINTHFCTDQIHILIITNPHSRCCWWWAELIFPFIIIFLFVFCLCSFLDCGMFQNQGTLYTFWNFVVKKFGNKIGQTNFLLLRMV